MMVFAGVFAPVFCANTPTGATLRSIVAAIPISFVIRIFSLAACCRVDARLGWTLIPSVCDLTRVPTFCPLLLWADVFDRDVKDIFAVEDEIAEAIVASVTPMAGQRKGSPG